MSRFRLPVIVGLPVAIGAMALLPATVAWAAPSSLSASAKGSAEVGKAGNATASAVGTFSADPGSGQFCYSVTATGLTDAAAMHIHKGAAGANGPVVIPLDAKKIGAGRTCVAVGAAVVGQIVADPSGYYFNVHTPGFPAGAVRGQLTASSPTAVNAGSGGHAADNRGLPLLAGSLVLLGVGLAFAGWRLARR